MLAALLSAGAAGVGALLSVPLVRFFLHPALKAVIPSDWKEVGNIREFASVTAPVKKLVKIEQRDGWRKVISDRPLYVCKDTSGKLCALSAVCPHLGCTLAWHDEKSNFVCPCHNGRFTAEGKLAGGPPPRSMDTLELKLDGEMLLVRYKNFRQLVSDKEEIA
jgi:menaquinol-cytochrome c reductase iron-sulfur subunit